MIFPKRENYQASEKPLIIVGSQNPVKISCTESAFSEAFNRAVLVNGLGTSSGVSDQPRGDEETYLGAVNRAKNARSMFPEADYWVGIEGGVSEDAHGMYAFAWVHIENKAGQVGRSKTATFYLPSGIVELIDSGMELGSADDQFFSRNNSKHQGGSVGILTREILGRKSYYYQAVVLALIPFLNENLYENTKIN